MATAIKATIQQGSKVVDILIIDKPVEHVMDKQVMILAIPKQSPPRVLLIDLQKLSESITINGVLEDETSQSALAKKEPFSTLEKSLFKLIEHPICVPVPLYFT